MQGMTSRKLRIALAIYAVLALLALWELHGAVRLVVWIFLGGLALKSWIAWKKEQLP